MDLMVIEQFLNTLDERTFSRHGEQHVTTEGLASVEALSVWLESHGLAEPGADLGPHALIEAIALRSALRAVLLEARRGGSDEGAAGAATEVLGRFPLRLAPDPSGGLRLAAATGVPGLDTILETVVVGVASGSWKRLKLCASPDCHWAFYDASRSGGGRWCSMEVCGNRNKTRTYRRKQAD